LPAADARSFDRNSVRGLGRQPAWRGNGKGNRKNANPNGIRHRLAAKLERREGEALEQLLPLIYEELHDLASGYLRRERSGHTLQPTALVNEAYLRLANAARPEFKNRHHFFGVAARRMRQVLVDHARKHMTEKRGSGVAAWPLNEARSPATGRAAEFIALDDALDALARFDARKAKAVELRFFGGLLVEETAEILGISGVSVIRDIRFAEAWLAREMRRA
jgi:RNA polymerase sigma factor (TIGR02999 family)